MKLEGEAAIAAPVAQAFARLLDPAVLAACIPGCTEMVREGTSTYTVTVKTGVGPVQGTFAGRVELSEIEPPRRYRMTISGKSLVGHVRGDAEITLVAVAPVAAAAKPTTIIRYQADLRVAGLIASVGGRLIEAAAKKVVSEFFARLAERAAERA